MSENAIETLTITGSWGTITANALTGDVIKIEHESEDKKEYEGITKFDVDEWNAWMVAQGLNPKTEGNWRDICEIGYWASDAYEAPAISHREFLRLVSEEPTWDEAVESMVEAITGTDGRVSATVNEGKECFPLIDIAIEIRDHDKGGSWSGYVTANAANGTADAHESVSFYDDAGDEHFFANAPAWCLEVLDRCAKVAAQNLGQVQAILKAREDAKNILDAYERTNDIECKSTDDILRGLWSAFPNEMAHLDQDALAQAISDRREDIATAV